MKSAKVLIKVLIVAVLVISVALIIYIMVLNKPEIKKRKPQKLTYLVSAQAIEPASEAVVVSGMGTVIPVRQVSLKSRVSGLVSSVADEFLPGGFFQKQQELLKVDSDDYMLQVSQAQAQYDNAVAASQLEQGRQEVAKREWDMLSEDFQASDLEKKLALRTPQLKQVQANVNIAKTALDQARLNLERTSVTVPFNCVVLEKYAELGANISTQETVADLALTDEFWISLSVPLDQLKWFDIPGQVGGKGSEVIVKYRDTYSVKGYVTGLLSSLEDQGLMAKVLVSIKDPLNLKKTDDREPLLLGDYVKVDIIGKQLDNITKFDRSALRTGSSIWVAVPVDNDDINGYTLDVRPVNVMWRDEDLVIIQDTLKAGEMLVTSGIAAPVQNMYLRVDGYDFTFKNQLSPLENAELNVEKTQLSMEAAEKAVEATEKAHIDAMKELETLQQKSKQEKNQSQEK